ncbi:Splicing factor 3B subunit 5 RDS3 complex subunit 10 [Olea europaea subsp. europaea]|uniref:Splicing factor 3B subunit 5 RDS3 complex subunit 10 n=1 Tax=Olea europaea subsp. europaea TaxID=158383 RepID=A0A8S0RM90_OLEEU|nr:Splicing factor 3B subunit 5 RDS3 complex subunit 10 [Olea europaea subsp. europaea]CAA2980574.1 Splicing factor 3B subunit 5 RDS3 complex subunit 10 [Olea europaea subsp. europaea]
MQASDRFNINSQLEHLQAKYVGTGHADMNRFEWAVNIQRDSYASYVGHYPMLAYFAVAENESIGRERYNFIKCFCPVVFHLREKMTELEPTEILDTGS